MLPWDNEIPTEQYQWSVLVKTLFHDVGVVTSVSVWHRPETLTQYVRVAFTRNEFKRNEWFEFSAPRYGPGREFFEQLNARIKLELSE